MDIAANGILSGIVLAFLIGPVFFTIIQTSIERGFRCGVWVAVGVSLSDAMYIVISYLGLIQFLHAEQMRPYLAYGGGVVLLLFGCYYLFIKSRKLIRIGAEPLVEKSWWSLLAKGFIINGLSPMVLFFWLATVGVATSQMGYSSNQDAIIFFGSIIVTVFVTDLIKAKLAAKLRRLVTPRFIQIMNIVLGLAIMVFAIRMMILPGNEFLGIIES
jgi:threonine/homoserine/homoserine lactone efflux protein